MDLRANTAVDVLIGPFVDKTDGNTTEDALTLTAAEIKLSKNGQALTLKSDVTAAAFDDDGYYNCELDATDTDTEGNLVLIVHQSANALPVRHEYNVLSEAAWVSLYAAKDTGTMDVNVAGWLNDTAPATPNVAGVPNVDVTHLFGTILAESGAGRLALAFNKLFDVVTPVLVASDVMVGTDSAATAASLATAQTDLDTLTDARGEPGQANPPVSTTTNEKIDYLYKMLRNRKNQTATLHQLFADDESTVDQKVVVSSDGTTAEIGEMATGP